MERAKGILYAALSSSTFGLAPLFTLLLLAGGYSPFEALSYRWGVAALFLGVLAVFSGRSFRLGRRELVTVFLLSLFRAATSLSLIIAYQHIASGVASTIHFMYPLAVALAMMCFFREKGSAWVFAAIGMSVVGAVLLSLGNVDFTVENSALGMVSACVSVFSYGGYIVGVRKSRAVEIDSAVLTCYVMGLGALYFSRPQISARPAFRYGLTLSCRYLFPAFSDTNLPTLRGEIGPAGQAAAKSYCGRRPVRRTTTLTAATISRIPAAPCAVKGSPKTATPMTTAVSGSKAPKIEVSVGPMRLIACTSVMLERAVAGSARPRMQSHVMPSVSIRTPPVCRPPRIKESAPSPIT